MDVDEEKITVDVGHQAAAEACVLVQTTTLGKDDGMALARAILEARLAAGAQITGPTHSLYWYEGDFGDSEEWQVEIVTTQASLPQLEKCIVENHPYGNPDIRILPIRGNSKYVAWIRREWAQAALAQTNPTSPPMCALLEAGCGPRGQHGRYSGQSRNGSPLIGRLQALRARLEAPRVGLALANEVRLSGGDG